MLIAAIAIILLVVGGVSVTSIVMQEHSEVVDAGVVIDAHSNERVKEELVLTSDSATDLQLHSKSQDVTILEYRVVDDAGTILKTCPVRQEIGASSTEAVDLNTALAACWGEFVTP